MANELEKPHKFYLNKQKFIYSMHGVEEESQWLYVVGFYQGQFDKIMHPFFDPNSKSGVHELCLFVDAKQIFVSTNSKIMWSSFKMDDEAAANSGRLSKMMSDESQFAL